MQKSTVTLLFLFLFVICSFGQRIALYDAAYLKSSLDASGKFKINAENKPIFSYFFGPGLSDAQIAALIQANPFLSPHYAPPGAAAGQKGLAMALPGITSSLGSIDITNLADGFAKFIVKLTKQELSIAFFDKFDEAISDTTFRDFHTLFPQTYRAFQAIGEEIYNYGAYMQTLRESFEKDLATMPSNLPSIIGNHRAFFDSQPELEAELKTSFYMAQAIQDKRHPGEIIENYPTDWWSNCNPNYQATFQTLALISASLKSNTEREGYWAQVADIKKLCTDDLLLKIYLGLLAQKAKTDNITFKNDLGENIPLSQIMENAYDDIAYNLPKYKRFIQSFALKIQSLETKIKGLKYLESDSLIFEAYYGVVSSSIEVLKHATEIETLPYFPEGLAISSKTARYFNIAQTASDMVIDVNRRNYSSAVVNGVHLYDIVFSPANIAAFMKGKPIASIKKAIEKHNNVSKAIFKYGSFMASVALAESSDEVENAIGAIALPAGSARIKRESEWNVSLNAFCGFAMGHESEKFWSFENSKIFNSFGVSAPVGIAVSHSLYRHSSVSLFASVIDLGAITTFRFVNDSTKVPSKIKLRDIISPGLFLSWGIPKCPISLNIGYQIAPLLKSVNATENTFQPSYSRFSIGLCVDIPILNFYTKPR